MKKKKKKKCMDCNSVGILEISPFFTPAFPQHRITSTEHSVFISSTIHSYPAFLYLMVSA